jgi:hypothetical protein
MDGDRDVSIFWLARGGAGSEAGRLYKPQGYARADAMRPGADWRSPKATVEPPVVRKLATAS